MVTQVKILYDTVEYGSNKKENSIKQEATIAPVGYGIGSDITTREILKFSIVKEMSNI